MRALAAPIPRSRSEFISSRAALKASASPLWPSRWLGDSATASGWSGTPVLLISAICQQCVLAPVFSIMIVLRLELRGFGGLVFATSKWRTGSYH